MKSTASKLVSIVEGIPHNPMIPVVHGLEDLSSPPETASDTVVLAVAFGIDKTIVWQVPEDMAVAAIKKLVDGGDWNKDVHPVLGPSSLADNNTNQQVARKATRLSNNADYWIDVYDPSSWQEALDQISTEGLPDLNDFRSPL